MEQLRPEYQALLEKISSGVMLHHKETTLDRSPVVETPIVQLQEPPHIPKAQSPVKEILADKILVFNWKDLDKSQLDILNSFSDLNCSYRENIQEMEYFDYLNTNIGSSVFLQYPKLFTQILDGLLSVHQYKFDLTLNYLLVMVDSWSVESKNSQPTTFADTQMDVTAACLDIFFKLVKLLNFRKADARVMRLLYAIAQFIKLRKDKDLFLQLFELVISVTVEEEWFQKQISSYAFSFLVECVRDIDTEDPTSIALQTIEILLKYPHLHIYIIELCKTLQDECFYQYILMKTRGYTETDLVNNILAMAIQHVNIRRLLPYSFSLKLVSSSNENETGAGLTIVRKFMSEESFIDVLPFIQVYSSHDEEILEKVGGAITQLDRNDQLIHWIRGLLSRNTAYRNYCCKMLESFNLSSKEDLFLFDANYLSSLIRLVPIDGPYLTFEGIKETISEIDIGKLYSPSFFQNLSTVLQNDGRIRERFVLDQLYIKLIYALQIGIQNDLDLTGCIKCLNVLLKGFSVVRDYVTEKKDFLIDLFKVVVQSFDLNLRFQTANLYSLAIFDIPRYWKTVILGDDVSQDELCFPELILDGFFMYGVGNRTCKYKSDTNQTIFKEIWAKISILPNSIDADPSIQYRSLELASKLKLAKSNKSFQEILSEISNFAVKAEYATLLVSNGIFEIFSSNEEDYHTLNDIVLILLNFQNYVSVDSLIKLSAVPLFRIVQDVDRLENEIKTQVILNIAINKELAIFYLMSQLMKSIVKLPGVFCSDYLVPLEIILPFSRTINCVSSVPTNVIFNYLKTIVETSRLFLNSKDENYTSGYNNIAAGRLALKILRNLLTCTRLSGISVDIHSLQFDESVKWIYDDLLNHNDSIVRALGIEILSNLVFEKDWLSNEVIHDLTNRSQKLILDLTAESIERTAGMKFYYKMYRCRASSSNFSFLCAYLQLIVSYAYSDISVIKSKLGELHFFEQIFKLESIYNSEWSKSKFDFIINLLRLVELLINYDDHFLRFLLEHCSLGNFLSFIIVNTTDPGTTLSAQRLLSRSINHLQRNNLEMLMSFFSFEHGGKYLFPLICGQLKTDQRAYIQCARTILAQILQLELDYGIDLKIDLALVTSFDDSCVGNVLADNLIQQYCTENEFSQDLYRALELILRYLPVYKNKTATSKSVLPIKIEKEIESMIMSKIDLQKVSSLLDIASVLCVDSDYTKVSFVRNSFIEILLLLLLDKTLDQRVHLKALYCVSNLISDSLKNKRKLIQLHKQSPSKSLLHVLIKLCQKESTSELVFDECVEIFKTLTSGLEFRTFIFKAGFVNSFNQIFQQFLKAKNYHKVSSVLGFFKTCCIENCGIFLAQIPETFKENCVKLLGSNSIKTVYMMINLIWCLVHEYEKAKGDFKQYGLEAFNELLARIDEQPFEIGDASVEMYQTYFDKTKEALLVLNKLL
ncbi:hypothetical protein HK103_007652 [Boothiomyces macroporosus]|uniref:Uncharacterized protein n=1 Tax=Boothiomyces macroporosus TaxID=261099 RepID=A0AAD5UF50_9FUNG|nr:hypothetical protein HK103_007652 [Boothiomyces macroporosus]